MDWTNLKILNELIKTKNISEASRNLNLSRNTVYSKLKTLQMTFKDELVIFDENSTTLTQQGKEIEIFFTFLLTKLEALEGEFHSKNSLTIGIANGFTLNITKKILNSLSPLHPNIKFFYDTFFHLLEDLKSNKIHALIVNAEENLYHSGDLNCITIEESQMVLVKGRGQKITPDSKIIRLRGFDRDFPLLLEKLEYFMEQNGIDSNNKIAFIQGKSFDINYFKTHPDILVMNPNLIKNSLLNEDIEIVDSLGSIQRFLYYRKKLDPKLIELLHLLIEIK